MNVLTQEEELILQVAAATCFLYPLDPDGTPIEDVHRYVSELIELFHRKPTAAATHVSDGLPHDVRSTLQFCADRLASVAPEHAARLNAALAAQPPGNGTT